MFTRSLVVIEYTLIVHPFTRVTYPRTLKGRSGVLVETVYLFYLQWRYIYCIERPELYIPPPINDSRI